MQSQKRVRDELQFVTEFTTLFDVMQQAAVSQLRKTEGRVMGRVRLTELITRDYMPLLPPMAQCHPLVQGGQRGRLLVVMTSDEGMVGPLHSAVVREAMMKVSEMTEADQTGVEWLLVGQRGLRLLGDRVVAAQVMAMPSEEHVEEPLQRLAELICTRYTRHGLRDAWLVAPRFVSPTRQEVALYQLLPLVIPSRTLRVPIRDLVIEPSLDGVLEPLALFWVEAVYREAFWSARRADFAARALHIEVSRDELNKRARVVRHEFFKTLHERIDILVRETCVVQRHAARRLLARGVLEQVQRHEARPRKGS